MKVYKLVSYNAYALSINQVRYIIQKMEKIAVSAKL